STETELCHVRALPRRDGPPAIRDLRLRITVLDQQGTRHRQQPLQSLRLTRVTSAHSDRHPASVTASILPQRATTGDLIRPATSSRGDTTHAPQDWLLRHVSVTGGFQVQGRLRGGGVHHGGGLVHQVPFLVVPVHRVLDQGVDGHLMVGAHIPATRCPDHLHTPHRHGRLTGSTA